MTTLERSTRALPIAAVLLLLGALAAVVSPGVRSTLSQSFVRQPSRYVELYFADPTRARACPARNGSLEVVATVRSHLGAAETLTYAVRVTAAGGRQLSRSTGVVPTQPDRPVDFGATVRTPASAYTVDVTFAGRAERLAVHCAAGSNR